MPALQYNRNYAEELRLDNRSYSMLIYSQKGQNQMKKNFEKYKPTKTHVKIIKEWSKVELKHPSFQEVADKAHCSKSLVSQIITRLERGLIEGYENSDETGKTGRK